MLTSLFIKGTLVCGLCYFLRTILERIFIRSTLDDLPGPPNKSRLLGNIPQLFHPKGWAFHHEILKTYGRAMRIRGAFGERLLVTFDPRALHHVLVKDQVFYEESEAFTSRNSVFFGEGLLSTHGGKHRKQRKMLNPVFSINHMREMIPLFYEVTERLRTVLKKKTANGPQEIDVLHWITRTALELIGQSGMGYSFDPLVDDVDHHPYSRSVKKLVVLSGGPVGFFANQFLFPFAHKFDLPRFKRFLVKQIPWKRVQDLIEITDIMHQTSLEIIKAKREAMASPYPEVVAEMANKKDIISILMRANALASVEDRMSDAEVVGQVSCVWLDNLLYHTLSPDFFYSGRLFLLGWILRPRLSRILYLLATHQDVQDRLRKEIQEAQKYGELTYDQLVFLPYLDAVCRETLRVYPPINLAPMRTAQKDMVLPLSKPIQDSAGKEVTEILVQKGTNIVISVLGANCNPDLWGADSYEWKPERWLSPLPKAVEEAHMPGIYSHL
ncbi:hypothetical protein D9756_005062 [Leucocoprinus leucothites]|uniref:Cytochrome P450 n=1 Tax=Leucocoprinus leucothites TaxID=201217 RepID=A0A8H5G924_9AGAR|nr:hypothetical protein D9756_005062 [Leucoagaricus leucothites]